jgi:uncharacterized damage-inducible protein DinB
MSDSVVRAGESAARLEAAADAMLTEVASLPSDLITWKPADDVWSIMEILCHVAEFVPYWTSQTLQIVRRPEDQWGRNHTDTARLDAVQRAGSRSLSEVTTAIRTGVQKSAAEIREFRDADLAIEAMSRNPRWARKPASFIIDHLLIEHVEKHLSQIRRNVKQFHERGLAT